MKTIKRTDDMPKNAQYLVMNDDGSAFALCGERKYNVAKLESGQSGWSCNSDLTIFSWKKINSLDDYCKNWKKSLRKIVDEPLDCYKLLQSAHKKIKRLQKANKQKSKSIELWIDNYNGIKDKMTWILKENNINKQALTSCENANRDLHAVNTYLELRLEDKIRG